MLNQLKIYENFIIGGLLIVASLVVYFYIDDYKSEITRLKNELKDTQIELANSKLESERFKNAVDEQNTKIQNLKVSKKDAIDKLAKWKDLPPKIKYKTITKIREVKSDECEDIKNTLDAVKLINPNIL